VGETLENSWIFMEHNIYNISFSLAIYLSLIKVEWLQQVHNFQENLETLFFSLPIIYIYPFICPCTDVIMKSCRKTCIAETFIWKHKN
jgi:hypothetical protein